MRVAGLAGRVAALHRSVRSTSRWAWIIRLQRAMPRVTLRPVHPPGEVCTVKKIVGGGAVALAMMGSASTVAAAALTPGVGSDACAAYFGVAAGPEPLSACQWD